jgi:putative endopeptidase
MTMMRCKTMTRSAVVVILASLVLAAAGAAQTASSAHGVDPGWMNRAVDPCTDFFAYSCGGWLRGHPIPPDQSAWSVYSEMQENTRGILLGILESAAAPKANRSAN